MAQNKPPKKVLFGVRLLSISLILYTITQIIFFGGVIPSIITGLLILLHALFIYKIYKGKDWARIAYAVAVLTFSYTEYVDPNNLIALLIHIVIAVPAFTGIILVFQESKWFK